MARVPKKNVRLKRAYDEPEKTDGTRVLVFASDDNFNPAQANQILITAYRPSPPCAP